MGEILRNATLIELDPPRVEVADLRIEGDHLAARGPDLKAEPGDLETDLTGRQVMPGLVSAHTHLAFGLGGGAPGGGPCFELSEGWSRVDRALADLASVEIGAALGALQAIRSGTTTVFDHHSSPSCVAGSLGAVQSGMDRVGLRGVLSYAISDRLGIDQAQAGLAETERFLPLALGRYRAMVGAYAPQYLEDSTLAQIAALAKSQEVGVHFHSGETAAEDRDSQSRFKVSAVERIVSGGFAGPRSISAHGTMFSWEDLAALLQQGTWMCHLPQANMITGVGYAPAGKFGPRTVLGTEHLTPDMFSEVRAAVERSREAGAPLDPLRVLSAGHKLATLTFGRPFGALRPGAVADIVVLDHPDSLGLSTENLAHHMVSRFTAADVDAVMVDGCWRLWARQSLKVDATALAHQARQAAGQVWEVMAQL